MVGSSARRRAGRFAVGLVIGGMATALLAQAPAAVAADGPPVTVIVTYTHQPGAAEKQAIKALGGKVSRGVGLINGLVVTMPSNILAAARLGKNVKTVERDATITAFEPVTSDASTGDFEYDNAWGVAHVGTKAVHDAGITGAGVKVAVIDTGIDYVHDVPPNVDPEFLNNYKGGYDFVNHDADPMDDNGHGTHVAGILAAERNHYLVVGMAPGVDLYALKILDSSGQGEVSDLILALQWAVDNHMDVVNMSLGTHEVSPALETAVANASAAGLLMVAASGNAVTIQDIFNGCAVAYPGAYPQVLSTTFTNQSDAITGYSCTGPEVDIASPGDGIISTVPVGSCQFCSPNGYAAESGTSMASPHVAGTVALMLSAGITDTGAPGLFDDVRAKLCSTANVANGGLQGIFGYTPIPQSDPRYASFFGCGELDAAEAVLGYEPPPPPNDPPIAVDDALVTYQDTPADANVLANDTDPNGDTLAVSTVSMGVHGTTSVNPNGTVHYVPDSGYVGSDAFTYAVSDGHGGIDSGQVTVQVAPFPDPPPDAPVLFFPGIQATAGTTVNRLSDFFTPTSGTGIELWLTKPLSDAGNVGVFCQGTNENHYEAATVGIHRWGLTSTGGSCFVYSWNGSTYRPGTRRCWLVHDPVDGAATRDAERQPLVRRRC